MQDREKGNGRKSATIIPSAVLLFLTGRNNNMHNFGLTAVTVPQAEEYGEGNILQKQFSQIVEKEIERKMEPYWKLTENPEYLTQL